MRSISRESIVAAQFMWEKNLRASVWLSTPLLAKATIAGMICPIVSRGENEKLTRIADREFVIQQTLDRFDRPPASLDGEEMGWEYFSPLAQAQQLSALETFQRVVGILEAASQFDEGVADNVDLDKATRTAIRSAGLPVEELRAPDAVAAIREARAERMARDQALAEAAAGASAARDAGQAAASLGLAGPQQREAA